MIGIIIVCVLLIILLLFTYFIANVEIKKSKTKISFKDAMDLTELPVVVFNSDNRKLNFLLDTGSNVSYINESVLNTLLYSENNKVVPTFGVEGTITDCKFCNIEISYKDCVYSEEFAIKDLNDAFDLIKKESGVQIHGILGSKFFEKYKYVIDFNELIAYAK